MSALVIQCSAGLAGILLGLPIAALSWRITHRARARSQ